MFIIVFESTTPASKAAVGAQYYTQMQALLRSQPGFISETPFASPIHPDQAVLIAKWETEAGVHVWRTQHEHLRIQYKARRSVFAGYRLRVGPELSGGKKGDEEEEEGEGEVTQHAGRFVVLYEGPVSSTSTVRVTDLLDSATTDGADVAKDLVDASVYQGEKSVLWISSWTTEAAAVGFQKAIRRMEGDDVLVFRVKRDYGAVDRGEAPVGADAEQAASIVDGE